MWLMRPIWNPERNCPPFLWQEHLTFFCRTTLLILGSREGCNNWSYAFSWSNWMLSFPEGGDNRKNLLEPIASAEVCCPAGSNFCCLSPQSFTVPSFCPSSVLQSFPLFYEASQTLQIDYFMAEVSQNCSGGKTNRGRGGHETLTCGWCSGFC